MPKKLRRGKHAEVSVLLKYLHPQKLVNDKFPNRTATSKIDKAIVVRCEEKKVTRKQQLCCVLTHESFPDNEVHCVERYARVTKEGPEDYLYDVFVTERDR